MSSGNPWTIFPDQSRLGFGDGLDLRFYHDGTNSYVENEGGNLYIRNDANDKDIIFQCDDGSGGATTYLLMDGSNSLQRFYTKVEFGSNASGHDVLFYGATSGTRLSWDTSEDALKFLDSTYLYLGTGSDLKLYHDASNSYINNATGDLIIQNNANDKDIIFQSDDGSGGVETYFFLDGSQGVTIFPDSSILGIGNGADFQVMHNGTHTYLQNQTGTLYIRQNTNDGDIKFESDDGSGGTTAYLTLDGSAGYTTVQKRMRFDDNKEVQLGAGGDLSLKHVSNQSYIDNSTGNLNIRQKANDGDIVFECDDGSGGDAEYLRLDGGTVTIEVAKEMNLAVPLATDQQKHLAYFEFKGYGTADGTNYYIPNIVSDTNAPFEHGTSTGADGLTAQTTNVIVRAGGTTMPRAGNIKVWRGWAASAGTATINISLFKATPTRNDSTNLTPVLLKNTTFSALGNDKMEDFDETSFSVAVAEGDILFTGVQGGTNNKAFYFTSTLEVEWS